MAHRDRAPAEMKKVLLDDVTAAPRMAGDGQKLGVVPQQKYFSCQQRQRWEAETGPCPRDETLLLGGFKLFTPTLVIA